MAERLHTILYEADPLSGFSDTIRVLRSSLVQSLRTGLKRFLICSCWPGEGRTLLTLNLAAAFAQLGHKVLLVDGDLRARGLTELAAFAPTVEMGLNAPFPGLTGVDLMAAPVVPGREILSLLTSADFRATASCQFERYSVVLVDSPPLSLVRDGFLLGSLVDGAVLLASRRTFRGIPEGHASEDLRESGVNVLGVVALDF